jgi:formylglycine-generating enzyme required for sulfatase activity
MGICRDTGHYECNAAKDGVTCVIDTPGQPATTEKCNNKDDDCNGVIDNNVKDDMVHVVDGPLNFYIYQYEASHPDATSTSAGGLSHRSCSQPEVLPWAAVTQPDASSACIGAGKRLCTEEEWQSACEGPLNRLYPYGTTYQANTCNGNDFDPNCTGIDDDRALVTGEHIGCPEPGTSSCFTDWTTAGKIYDMSGNLREWTSTGCMLKRIRGGAYDNVAEALTCRFDFWAQAPSTFNVNLGFRCCAANPD